MLKCWLRCGGHRNRRSDDTPECVRRCCPVRIVILTDDQGYGDLACHGNTMIRTPNLDQLHAESVRLTDYHVDPTCAPTRAALMTGRYSTRTGVWHTIMGRSLLYRDEVTMADVFKSAGYRTALFGKWHLGDNYPRRPEDRGFEERGRQRRMGRSTLQKNTVVRTRKKACRRRWTASTA